MTATLGQLVDVRSQVAEELRRFYETTIETLDRTPWYRNGHVIRASQIAIPARVLKEDSRPRQRPHGEEEREDDGTVRSLTPR